MISPTKDEFCKVMESVAPNIVYFQGERLPNDEVGSLVWEDAHDLPSLFGSSLPTTVRNSKHHVVVATLLLYVTSLCIIISHMLPVYPSYCCYIAPTRLIIFLSVKLDGRAFYYLF